MRKYYIIICCLLMFELPVTNAQDIKALSVGDKIPEILINKLLNGPTKSTKLSDLAKGRFIILDFFATWCGPCIEGLPHLQKYQNKYRDKLLILPVSYESESVVAVFMDKHKELDNSLTYAVEDKQLKELFLHRIIPHEIWIDKNGIVKAITDGYYLTEKNLVAFMGGQKLGMPIKKDLLVFDRRKPLLINGNGGPDTAFIYKSLLTKRIQGVSAGASVDRTLVEFKRYAGTNQNPLTLFFRAYNKFGLGATNRTRIILNVRDSTQFYTPTDSLKIDDWQMKNTFCYELTFNNYAPDSVFFGFMFDDLNKYFNIKGSVRKKETPCFILYRINSNDSLIATSNGSPSRAYTGKLKNRPISDLVEYLNGYQGIIPVLDETGYTGNVDISLDFNIDIRYPAEIEGIRNGLRKYGLDLKIEKRIVDLLYIEDKQ